MPETSNTAEMAKKVSSELFSEFGWEQKGPEDVNWGCVSQKKHGLETHPSDVVFWYPDPYDDAKVFLNTDLKSYAAGSLKKPQIRDALTRLCKATDCANVATDWRNLYGDDNANYRCHGLLFVYNHDGEYDGDFEKFFDAMDTKDIPLEGPNRVFVFSPATVDYLNNIAVDLQRARGNGKLPAKGHYSFYYPDFIGPHPKRQNQAAASIEVLLSPWQIIRFVSTTAADDGHTAVGQQVQYFVYYRGTGSSMNEFKYLFDAFFRYDLLGDDGRVSLRMPFADQGAAGFFDRAKDAYADDFYGLKEFRTRLNRITFDPIDTFKKVYSTVALGMKARNPHE
jgi:hypothetical protein